MPGSTGIVSVSGNGANWTTNGNLVIGSYGNATLTIGPGGLVRNSEAYVGLFADSVSSVTISGQDARWSTMNRILIGVGGDATLTISGGGTVTNKEGVIGNSSTSVDTVFITGKDVFGTASTWNVGGNLSLDADGSNI